MLLWARYGAELQIKRGAAERSPQVLANTTAMVLPPPIVLTPPVHADSTRLTAPRPAPVKRPPILAKNPSPPVDSTPAATQVTAALSAEEAAIHEPLDRFATAMGNGEEAIRDAFPGVPQPLLDPLKSQFFSKVDHIRATPVYGSLTISGDHAELPFTLQLRYQFRDSKSPGAGTIKYRASLDKRDDHWQITQLVSIPPG
jgi:hypothetical protein